MSRFLSQRFSQIKPYVPGEQPQDTEYIKLNTNESPYPPSPRVLQVVNQKEVEKLRLYSDPEVKQLIQQIADFYQVSTDQVFVGNGSDEVLAFSFMAFCDQQQQICYPDITYGFYQVFCQLFGLQQNPIPLKQDFTVDYQDYCDCGKNIVIANPNAPTGLSLSLEEIEQILKTNPDHLVMIDEAYVDFGGTTCIPLLKQYSNLMVIQTFSKSRSLAGARLGFAISSPEIIQDLNKIKFSYNPYNVNRLSILAGSAAMQDRLYWEYCTNEVIQTRNKTKCALEQLGFTVLDSKTNFLFARCPKISGEDYYSKLKQNGILVRHFDQERIQDFVRITIGTPAQMEQFLQVTKRLMEEETQ
ncbi:MULTISPECIES: histidinol-phosphate transaminase [Clostridiaceae]|uniref:Histidinol-phosphate aminotransferase n=1 Tax=Clostridium facile TaxID=2763035 RepID=A0ABR7ISQ5_9CLOT|nr:MULTISPECIES: histidinol-phosphate transaminase [Clostridiaceae]MBC5788054.1 histidinol-phosphate transaminase [Clostridium facile]PWN00188.1 MAG: histidinol-phosphate transaminase [Massilioclostridium sp.]